MSFPPKITEHQVFNNKVRVWHPQCSTGSDGYCISLGSGGWMPGVFDSVESAIKGAELCFTDESSFVEKVQAPINHLGQNITLKDMD